MQENKMKGTVQFSIQQVRPKNQQKGAIKYTMPSKPQQKYRLMYMISIIILYQVKKQKQISMQIQFIPFCQIRNLIITFMKPYQIKDKQYSQLLQTEYKQSKQLMQLDIKLSQKINKSYHQHLKLSLLYKTFNKIKQYTEKINKLSTEISSNNLSMKLMDEKRPKQEKYNKQRSQLKKQGYDKYEDELKEIQSKQTKQIISIYERFSKQFQQKNTKFIQFNTLYQTLTLYSLQIQKILPIIWKQQTLPDKSASRITSLQPLSSLLTKIFTQKVSLQQHIQQSQTYLQIYRDAIKTQKNISNGEILTEYKKNVHKWVNVLEEKGKIVKENVYGKVIEFERFTDVILKEYERKIKKVKDDYKDFVIDYTNIREIVNCQQKMDDFYALIADEENSFTDHLKNNCLLIVYYKPSLKFQQFSNNLPKRKFVREFFKQRIQVIEKALQFNNIIYSIYLFIKQTIQINITNQHVKIDYEKIKYRIGQRSLENMQRNIRKKKCGVFGSSNCQYEQITNDGQMIVNMNIFQMTVNKGWLI